MVLWVLFLFDDEVEFGPFRFNVSTNRQRRGKYDSSIQEFCEGLETFDKEGPDSL